MPVSAVRFDLCLRGFRARFVGPHLRGRLLPSLDRAGVLDTRPEPAPDRPRLYALVVPPPTPEPDVVARASVRLFGPARDRAERVADELHALRGVEVTGVVAEEDRGIPDGVEALRLHMRTPLRLVRSRRPMKSVNSTSLGQAILGRARAELGPRGDSRRPMHWPMDIAAAALRWHPMHRFSTRQGRRIPLGGLLGHVDIVGPWAPPQREDLAAVALLGLGRGTTCGLGRVDVEVLH